MERLESSMSATNEAYSLACPVACGRVSGVPCRAAYRRLIIVAHPDKGGSVEAFERVQHAYETLSAAAQS